MAREITADEMGDLVTSKIRSEVFDNRICDNCAEHDGDEFFRDTDGGYYDADGNLAPDLGMPQESASDDVHCLGNVVGVRCRGIYLYSTGKAED